MPNRLRAIALAVTGGALLLSFAAMGQNSPRTPALKIVQKPLVNTTAKPLKRPATEPDTTRRVEKVDRVLSGRRLPDSMSVPSVRAQFADCSAKLSVEAGEMLAGGKATIRFADDKIGRGAPIAVVNGEPVYAPNPAASNQPRLIMPRLQRLSLSYERVATSAVDGTMINGWFAVPGEQISTGTIIRDFRDGTAEVMLPPATDAIFKQQATLTVVTDRCTLTTPIAIRPATHIGRWFPPALVVRCTMRNGYPGVFEGARIDSLYRVEGAGQSRIPIAVPFNPRALYHNCGPYGALHEGGNDQGAGSGSGTDIYVFWDGGFDPAFSLTPITDPKTESCIAGVTQTRHPDGGSYIGRALSGGNAARYAGRSVLEVKVSWKITAPHGYCWYTLAAKGRHPVSLTDTWATRFTHNHRGIESSMIHAPSKTDFFWVEDMGGGRRGRNVVTATF